MLAQRGGERNHLAVQQTAVAARENTFRCALHHQQKLAAGGLAVDGDLILVGGVEGDLLHLRVLRAVRVHLQRALHELEQRRLASVADGFPHDASLRGTVAEHELLNEGLRRGRVTPFELGRLVPLGVVA